jgi:hypothetical protein
MNALYVIIFSNGVVKVGMTSNLGLKTKRLISSAKSIGVKKVSLWVTPKRVIDAEKEWLDICDYASSFMKPVHSDDIYCKSFKSRSEQDALSVIGCSKELFITCESVSTKDGKTMIEVNMDEQYSLIAKDVKISEKNMHKAHKTISTFGSDGVSHGVLKNRMRTVSAIELQAIIEKLVADGIITMQHRKNKTNSIDVTWYFCT